MQMILVTERVLGSLRNLQTAFAAAPSASESARSVRLSPLEVCRSMSDLCSVCNTASPPLFSPALLPPSPTDAPPPQVRLGLSAVCESLTFLHCDAGLAHCGVSPLVRQGHGGGGTMKGVEGNVLVLGTVISAPKHTEQWAHKWGGWQYVKNNGQCFACWHLSTP